MKTIAIFPGSFDPFTIGHADIVRRGLQLFDRIVIAVGYNAQKIAAPVPAAPVPAAPVPSAEACLSESAASVPSAEACLSEIAAPPLLAQRVAAIERIYAAEPRVKVVAYSDLTVDLAAREGARFLLRGVRSVKDFEYERDMAAVNAEIPPAPRAGGTACTASERASVDEVTAPPVRGAGGVETVLLIADPRYAHISSSLVRELQAYGRDVTPYLP